MENQTPSFWDKMKNPYAYSGTIVLIIVLRTCANFVVDQRQNEKKDSKTETPLNSKGILKMEDLISLYRIDLSAKKKLLIDKGFKVDSNVAIKGNLIYSLDNEDVVIYLDNSLVYAAPTSHVEKITEILKDAPYKFESAVNEGASEQKYYSNEDILISVNHITLKEMPKSFVNISNFELFLEQIKSQ